MIYASSVQYDSVSVLLVKQKVIGWSETMLRQNQTNVSVGFGQRLSLQCEIGLRSLFIRLAHVVAQLKSVIERLWTVGPNIDLRSKCCLEYIVISHSFVFKPADKV